jgi:hypothetical protein
MVKKLMVVLVVLGSMVLGFFVNEFLHIQADNEEMKLLMAESLELSERAGRTANSCMSSLLACTRVVDADNPQLRTIMPMPPGVTSAMQKRDGCVTTQRRSEEGVDPWR